METKELVISPEEYNNLPSYIKDKFQWIPQTWSSPYGDHGISGYIKGKSYIEIENDIKMRLREISETNGIKITVEEYTSLPINIKDKFQWIPETWSSPYGDHGISGYTKGKSKKDIEKDKVSRLEYIMNF
jgi:hypothetical protein